LCTRYVPLTGKSCIVSDEASARAARRDGLIPVALVDSQAMRESLESRLRGALTRWATSTLLKRRPHLSAARRLTHPQSALLCAIGIGLVAATVAWPFAVMQIVSLALSVLFTLLISMRVLAIGTPPPRRAGHISDDDLPTYSVLVPLFREREVLDQIIGALLRLDYPAGRLDIKLVLEESDELTVAAARAKKLPACFEIIVVPASRPQTKPKALNYALPFARGSLVTVFDAEDLPEPGQLRRAAEAFAEGPGDLACVQARLGFYNGDQNWLTRNFAVEYAMLFGRLLPLLGSWGLAFPLGGTSNHFRLTVLKQVGGWDPHNVTEDADLALRLARYGYRSACIDSETGEEATSALRDWIPQRTRWLKGWMQTWLVHMRNPFRSAREMGPASFAMMQLWLGGMILSALLHPLFLAWTAVSIGMGWLIVPHASLLQALATDIALLVLVGGYAAMAAAALDVARGLGVRHMALTLATIPGYWLLISIAAWKALWQLIRAPFHWNKTRHGVARIQPQAGCA
jgi:glycosyltransferase XagB